jgi:hypothetical protein
MKLEGRLKEPSTWAGIGGTITAIAGAWATKDFSLLIGAVLSLVAVFTKDPGSPS